MTEAWSLADQVEELRGKFHLKKKDSDAYRESSKQEMHDNYAIISRLRQENRARRVLLAQHENGDETVIKDVFRDEREERLALQRYTAAAAIEEMDQKVCELAKFLNDVLYDKEKREVRLGELCQELDRMVHLEQVSPDQAESHVSVTSLENALDKALIKYDTAKIISRRYQQILDKFKEESLTLPAKLDAMEGALTQQRAELRELRGMSRDALEARDFAKRLLSQTEQTAYQERRRRDAKLTATRKEVERRKSEAEKTERRAARATLVQDTQDQKAILEKMEKEANQQKMLSYEEAFQRIKETTHVIDIDDVVSRVQTQEEKAKHLSSQVAEMDAQRTRLKEQLETKLQYYHHIKYSGEQELSRGLRALEQMQKHVDSENRQYERSTDRLERNGHTLVNIKTGVNTLLDKLEDIKLRPPEHNYTRGDVFDMMDLCRKKLEQLMKEVNLTSTCSVAEEIKQKLDDAQFQDFLETQMPADNVRIKLQASDGSLAEFDYDSQDNEETLSRFDIKKIGQKMIDSKQRPKRRRVKKK